MSSAKFPQELAKKSASTGPQGSLTGLSVGREFESRTSYQVCFELLALSPAIAVGLFAFWGGIVGGPAVGIECRNYRMPSLPATLGCLVAYA